MLYRKTGNNVHNKKCEYKKQKLKFNKINNDVKRTFWKTSYQF